MSAAGRSGATSSVRTLSSRATFFCKVVFPAFWIVGGGFAASAMYYWRLPGAQAEEQALQFLFLWLGVCALCLAVFVGLKRVRLDDRFLYVSNYQAEAKIPLGLIADVEEGNMKVTIRFRAPTDFGDEISFMPRPRRGGGPHPVVSELKQLAQAAAKQG